MTDKKPSGEIDYVIDDPLAILADLEALGIEEVDKGVCEDTFANRKILRKSKLVWENLYSGDGSITGLLKVRSAESTRERRIQSLAEKRPILVTPADNNSDYLTGLDLIAEEASDWLVPPWVIGATRKWLKEVEAGGPPTEKRQPSPMPHRCKVIKFDGIRCMLWGSGRPQDGSLCRVHLRTLKSRTSDDIETARARLSQAAPAAVDTLEYLMDEAESEPVRLKAATEILDRAGIRGGVEIETNVNIDLRPAADVIQERLARLTSGAAAATLAASKLQSDGEIIDAEVVEEEVEEPASTIDEEPKKKEEEEVEDRPATIDGPSKE